MASAVIAYDKDLPEIPGRCPWEKPTSYLVKDDDGADRLAGGDVRPPAEPAAAGAEDPRRRWMPGGRPATRVHPKSRGGCSNTGSRRTTKSLAFRVPFRYYFCQREAIETLVWLVEIAGQRDTQDADPSVRDGIQEGPASRTTSSSRPRWTARRQIRRYVPELDAEGVQDLPPEDLRRFAFKMATGSGKTWVIAMAIVWSHFHKQRVPGSELSTNFLIVAPNVIVYQRLERDFASNRIFYELPLIPPEWRGAFAQKVILRGEATEPDPSGNLFLTNIHQLYESRDQEWTPQNAVEALLGKKPGKDLAAGQRSMLERVKSLKDLVVLNDEAHHVHDEDLPGASRCSRSIERCPRASASGSTSRPRPRTRTAMYFPWTVCDYPLAQAVEDRIVKAPLIVTKEDDPKQPCQDDPTASPRTTSPRSTATGCGRPCSAGRTTGASTRSSNTKPVLFIMAEKNVYADAIGEYLWKTKEFGFKESEVLVIHTDSAGEITKKDLEKAREAARDIDKADNRIKAIVSVMMLREGWDVRNVTVVLGLRPFTAKAEILPEQVIGRGLRLMTQVSPDRTQTLEVLGTRNLLNVLRTQLEAEGVGVGITKTDPPTPVIIEPIQERLGLRHRDPHHQAAPRARHPQAVRPEGRGARSRSSSRRTWPRCSGSG